MAVGQKIKRQFMAHFINTAKTGEAVYEKLGIGIEEMNIEMGANVQKTNDITGVNATFIDKYEKTQSIEPYMCREGNPLFERLQEIVDNDLTLDELNADVVDVKMWEVVTSGQYPAIKELCVIEVVSFGGNTEGYAIPFNVHRTGVKVNGTFDVDTKKFTATV